MKAEAQEPAALEKRAQPGRLRSIFLAVAVHLAFFALIIFGVSWQSSPTPPMQAELWDKLPPAPSKSPPPRPEPPPPKPEPPRPEPPKPEPPKKPTDVKPEPPKADPAIALRLEREKREKDKRERAEKQKQDDLKKKREQEDSAKKKREQEDAVKKRDDDKRRVEEERARKDAERAREEASNARQKLIDGFVDKIKARIRGRANVPDTVSGKPSVQVRIRILPGGEVLDITVTRSSGNRVYDTAIERAIRSASPLPVPEASSELFPQFRDLILNIEHER